MMIKISVRIYFIIFQFQQPPSKLSQLIMISGGKNNFYPEQIVPTSRYSPDSGQAKYEQRSITPKNNSYYSPHNDHNNSKFDNSNTLANLLMFQSGAYEQELLPSKKSEKHFTGMSNMLEEEDEAEKQNDSYPQYYKDNKENIMDDDFSEQSEDMLCNFILKLFGILSYKVRILQRGSFENMFIEASRRVMLTKCNTPREKGSPSKEDKEMNTYRDYRDFREQQKTKMISFCKNQQLESMMPIKEENESQITKKQSGITFNNNKNNGQFSQNSSELYSRPQSKISSSFPEKKNTPPENSSNPFSFNNNIKRKHISSFSHPSTSLGRKVEIESIQNVESVPKKSETRIKSQYDLEGQEETIRLEEEPFEYFQRVTNQKRQEKLNKNVTNIEIHSLPSEIIDINNNEFFEGMQALIDLSLYSRSNSQDQSENSEYLKIYQNKGVLVHYELDQNTEQETKDRSIPPQQHRNQSGKFSSAPFCQKLIHNGYAQQVKQSIYVHPHKNSPILNSPKNIYHLQSPLQKNMSPPHQTRSPQPNNFYPNAQNRHPHSRPTTQYTTTKNDIEKNYKNSPINNQEKIFQVNQQYGGFNSPSRITSPQQVQAMRPPSQIRRPVSHMEIRNATRATSPVTFIYPTPDQSARKNQINIRYVSPNTSRPKSEQPRIIRKGTSIEDIEGQRKELLQDKVHVVRSQYFLNSQPVNFSNPQVQRFPLSPNPNLSRQVQHNRVVYVNKAYSPNNSYLPNNPYSPKINFTVHPNEKSQTSLLGSDKPVSPFTRMNSQIPFRNAQRSSINDLFGETGERTGNEGDDGIIREYYDIDQKKPIKSKKKLQLVSSKESLKVIQSSKKSKK